MWALLLAMSLVLCTSKYLFPYNSCINFYTFFIAAISHIWTSSTRTSSILASKDWKYLSTQLFSHRNFMESFRKKYAHLLPPWWLSCISCGTPSGYEWIKAFWILEWNQAISQDSGNPPTFLHPFCWQNHFISAPGRHRQLFITFSGREVILFGWCFVRDMIKMPF